MVELSCSFLLAGSDQYIALQSEDLSTENLILIESAVLSDSAMFVILGRLSGVGEGSGFAVADGEGEDAGLGDAGLGLGEGKGEAEAEGLGEGLGGGTWGPFSDSGTGC